MKYRSLEEVAGRIERKRVPFSDLMPKRVRRILLVSSMYDSYTFQEDGSLGEMLFTEYQELNLSSTPSIIRVSTAEEAVSQVRDQYPDLVITMPRVGEMDVFDFARTVKEISPTLPVVLLAYDTRELAILRARGDLAGVDRIFVWLGDARLFLTIIKWTEDQLNMEHDADVAGVKSLILVEDSVRFYSAYLPQLYTEIMEQTQVLMAEGVNRMQQLMRMRARPKILLATTYEEALGSYRHCRDRLLGLIVDVRFPRGGRTSPTAGLDFARMVKEEDAYTPILIQSNEPSNEAAAIEMGAAFIDKRSPTLLGDVRDFMRAYLGFGDFVFRTPDGRKVAEAVDLRGLVKALRSVPDESLIRHATRNDFSTWLMARTEFDLAKALRPRKIEDFESPGELREYLLSTLSAYRQESRAGLVAQFSSDSFEEEDEFTRIGTGSLGGKGRGLAFVNSLLKAYEIENHVRGVRVFVPRTAVLATGVFDRFMADSDLAPLALSETPDADIKRAFLEAELPSDTRAELRSFLEAVRYPLAVRSSSLLEDSSFQPFAGIYETYMLPNQDPDVDVRLRELCRAIRLVYASTFSSDSKSYIESTPNRLEEEKMAVIIQQVVGRRHGNYIYPDIAGVTRSYDLYPVVGADPEDGVASVALGLGRMVVDGGRAVRFSPARPRKLVQFSSPRDYLDNAQREFYALDVSRPSPTEAGCCSPEGNLALLGLDTAMEHGTLDAVASVYSAENDRVYEGAHREGVRLVTMAGVLSGDRFPLPQTLSFLMDIGKAGFSCDVEIEFAASLSDDERPDDLAFLQIRPLVYETGGGTLDLSDLEGASSIALSGRALGPGRIEGIRDIVYVRSETFDRGVTVDIAAEVGRVNDRLRTEGRSYILAGPGRWGSADRWLGIPVRWSQISSVGCMIETPMKDMKVAPSQGTHFFQNITSFGIGYLTVDPGDPPALFDEEWLDTQKAAWESDHLRHIAFDEPVEIAIDTRRRTGVVMKPGARLRK